MSRTKAKARRGESRRAFENPKTEKAKAQRMKQLGVIPGANGPALLSNNLQNQTKHGKKKRRQRREADGKTAEDLTDLATEEVVSPVDVKASDNKRASDGDTRVPSKKTKKDNNSYTENDVAQTTTQDISTDIEASASLESTDSANIAVDPKVLGVLASTHTITNMNIISSSSIQQKVTKILDTLSSFSFTSPAKPNVVLLHAKASVAQKLITVVDIATREIAKGGGRYYQYNRLDRITVEQERKSSVKDAEFTILGRKVEPDPEVMDVDGDEIVEESAFETMMLPNERAIAGKPIKRVIPGMTIWLSRVRIESLRTVYWEQSNDTN